MASSPSTGDRPQGGFRRTSSQFATVPQRSLTYHERAGLANEDATAEVLFSHDNIHIYTFRPPTDALQNLDKTKKTLPDADYPIDAIEVLPWRSRMETLTANGRLVIEKVQGSVHFLKAGQLIHTIMRNSQCWCVDGESRFVMRVGTLKYYRIEFPTSEEREKQMVDEFKEVISKLLRYEKTPCPFVRAFQIDLPDDAITPRRRGAWKRKENLSPATPVDELQNMRKSKTTRTLSMRGMPPTAFPSKSMSYLEMDRPRTASTPTSAAKYSFSDVRDVRTESPVSVASADDKTGPEEHDSGSEEPGSSQHSESEEGDRHANVVPIIRSPLRHIQNAPLNDHSSPARPTSISIGPRRASTVEYHVQRFENYKLEPDVGLDRHTEHVARSTSQDNSDPSPTVSAENLESPDATSADQHSTDETDSLYNTLLEEVRSPRVEAAPDNGLPWFTDHKLPYKNGDVARSELPNLESNSVIAQAAMTKSVNDEAISLSPGRHRDWFSRHGHVPSQQHRLEDNEAAIATEAVSLAPNIMQEGDSNTRDEPPTKLDVYESLGKTRTNDDAESVVSTDSFHTLISEADAQEQDAFSRDLLNTRSYKHRRELSEMTVTAASMQYNNTLKDSPILDESVEILSSLSHDADNVSEADLLINAPGAFLEESELRQRLRHRRSPSSLPPTSILRTSSPSDHKSQIPTELLQKAATLAVVKPIEVVLFVFHILARIAAGATMNDLVSGDLFRRPGGSRRTASGAFESAIRTRNTSVATGSEELEEQDEDDFGLPVLNRRTTSMTQGERTGRSRRRDDDSVSVASID